MTERAIRMVTGFAGGAGAARAVRAASLPGVTHYEINLPKLPKSFDGLRAAHLSDLHNKVFGKYNLELYELIAAESPDVIFMTGDMVSHKLPDIPAYLSLVRLLAARFPLYYVNGNHELSDMDEKTFERVRAESEKAGAVCLDNACVEIRRKKDKIRICGLCYTAEYYRGVRQYKKNWKQFSLEDMVSCVNITSTDDFTVLLAHNPLDFEIHAQWGADLSFGGHIHGGFIRLPFIKGIISPELKLMPKYKEGVYYRGNSALVVSRGLGRIRFFNKAEVVLATLRRGGV
ncbi:MAG: metallophosphoesterase [Oscillospiraceae bacterium]|nr:metallophosphoesterase [Oscillospiraceae bacterium]